MRTRTVLITVAVPAAQLWSNVFGSGFQTWSWWKGVEYLGGTDWQTPGRVRLTIEYGDGILTKEIGLDDLVAAWNRAVETCSTLGRGEPLDHEDLDASDGDCVLQIAVLGQVEFA